MLRTVTLWSLAHAPFARPLPATHARDPSPAQRRAHAPLRAVSVASHAASTCTDASRRTAPEVGLSRTRAPDLTSWLGPSTPHMGGGVVHCHSARFAKLLLRRARLDSSLDRNANLRAALCQLRAPDCAYWLGPFACKLEPPTVATPTIHGLIGQTFISKALQSIQMSVILPLFHFIYSFL